ncbi:MAG: YidC/Oxa1 family insertase periplasmic-domain containing protein, partial [Phycisphaerae bacterium]|nr:YidC/Oxa1 family insertase periplasmic-domain containing protein [Phycisphaerae bacterium]
MKTRSVNVRRLCRALRVFAVAVSVISFAAPTTAAPATASAPPVMKPAGPAVKWYSTSVQAQHYTLGSLDPDSGYMFRLELTSEYAAIGTLKLSRQFSTVAHKKRYESDPKAYNKQILEHPEKDDGHYCLLNPVVYEDEEARYLPLATREYQIEVEDHGKPTRSVAKGWRRIKTKAPIEYGSQSLSFEMKVYRGLNEKDAARHPYLRVTKTYTVRKNDYTVQVTLRVKNLSNRPLKVGIDQRGPTGVPREDRRSDLRFLAWGQLAAPKQAEAKLRAKGKLSSDDLGRYSPIREINDNKPILWIGQTNKFFASVLYLQPEIAQRLQAANYQPEFYYGTAMESESSLTPFTGVKIPSLALAAAGKPGAVKTLTFDLFAGPKKRAMFDDQEAEFFKKQYKDLDYLGTIHFGACFFTIPLLTFGMMRLLNVLSMVALGNYGVAIILLVTLVRLVLHPLTKRSQISMMKMQKMAPQIAKLKEKYANDKETLNKEMMRVYKEQGTKPLLGCLPMLLQMPIWIALFTGLNAAVELRHAAFLPVWITDLTGPDA